jgi:mRNA interferase ChpB
MGAGTHTQGAIHCHQSKSLDWHVRKVRFKEKAPKYVVDETLARIEAILIG